MADPIDPKSVDKRIYERLVQGGHLDEKVYDKYLKSLPDVAEKATSVSTVMDLDDDVADDSDADDVDEGASA